MTPIEKLRRIADSTALDGVADAIREVADEMDWRPIETAPKDGSAVLVYRPLAHLTSDPHVAIKRSIPVDNGCWPQSVPEGMTPENFTDGA